MIYWLSTNSPSLRLLDPKISPEVEIYLRENQGVDSALLALDLGLSHLKVEAWQRQLGLRRISNKRDRP